MSSYLNKRNVRYEQWLVESLEETAREMKSSRLIVASAALWWLCQQMTLSEKVDIVGAYITAAAKARMIRRGELIEPLLQDIPPEMDEGRTDRRRKRKG